MDLAFQFPTNEKLEQVERSAAMILDNALMRITTVVAVIVFVAVASWRVGGWFTMINSSLEDIKTEVQNLSEGRWRHADQIVWCRETELTNPGWKCGDTSRGNQK